MDDVILFCMVKLDMYVFYVFEYCIVPFLIYININLLSKENVPIHLASKD